MLSSDGPKKSPLTSPIVQIICSPEPKAHKRAYRMAMIRRPSSSTISKIFFFETAGPIVLILHIQHLQVGGKNNCVVFYLIE